MCRERTTSFATQPEGTSAKLLFLACRLGASAAEAATLQSLAMSGLDARQKLHDAVEMLKLTMISRAQGEQIDDAEYARLRAAVLSNPEISRRVPGFVRTCSNARLFWAYIREQSPSYQGRREYLRDVFAPVLAYLESAPEPVNPPYGAPAQALESPQRPPAPDLQVFLCHASPDKAAVRELYARLRSDGARPWLDEEDLLPGQEWEPAIRRAIRQSDVVLVCLSTQSVGKAGYIQREIRFALDVADEQPEGTIFLIPVLLAPCEVPDRLARWQWVRLFEQDGYVKLLRALESRANNSGRR